MHAVVRTLGFVVEAAVAVPAIAQDSYPSRPVHIVVPYPPGGGVDAMTRRIAQKLSEQMGASFVVENKVGATGTIGSAAVAKAAPDGYTLLANDSTFSMLPYVFKTLPWNHPEDFVPITMTSVSPGILVVAANARFGTLADLIAHAKQNPGQLTYGTGGVGSSLHFAMESFALAAGIKLRHIPFKGAGEAVAGLLSGTVDVVMGGPSSALSLIKGGKVRPLAVASAARIEPLPEIKTFAEQGIRYEMSFWTGLAAPKGTPPEIVARLHAETRKALESPELKAAFGPTGILPGGMPPAQFSAAIRTEIERYKAVAASAGIAPE